MVILLLVVIRYGSPELLKKSSMEKLKENKGLVIFLHCINMES